MQRPENLSKGIVAARAKPKLKSPKTLIHVNHPIGSLFPPQAQLPKVRSSLPDTLYFTLVLTAAGHADVQRNPNPSEIFDF